MTSCAIARGFYVTIESRGTNEQRDGKECEMKTREVENMKTIECKKIHEIAIGKGSLP